MTTQPIYVVDAFADEPFTGNPAAVVPLTEKHSDEWMQAVAIELNLSETAFVDVSEKSSEAKSLRWFSIKGEVDICGHATLAAAHVLGGSQRFATRSGELQCTAGENGYIEMNFPADPPRRAEMDWNKVFPGLNVLSTWKGSTKYLVEVASADEVRELQPAFPEFLKAGLGGVIVTAPSDVEGFDFVSRYFHPAMGVSEDSATGSAHCTLVCWWAPRIGRSELNGLQLSPRTGKLRVRLDGDRVHLAGRAVTVLRGELAAH